MDAPTGSTFRFVFMGRLLQRKGLAEMLEAYQLVQSVHPDVHLDIYGNGLSEENGRDDRAAGYC